MCVTHRLDESVCFPQLSALERSQVSQPPSGLVEEGASVIKARAGLPGGKLTLRVNLALVEEIKLPAEAAELHDRPQCVTTEARPMRQRSGRRTPT